MCNLSADLSEWAPLMQWEPKSWQRYAACRPDANPLGNTPFYPDRGDGERGRPSKTSYRLAKLICQKCPVRWTCLFENLDEVYGCWGGATYAERLWIQRAVRIKSVTSVRRAMEELEERGSVPREGNIKPRKKSA